jgi:N-acetylneuraminic acid mutarotase
MTSGAARRALLLLAVTALVASATACDDPATWKRSTPSGFARQEVSFVYLPNTGTFLLAGGRSTVQESYNPLTGSWKTVAPLPTPLDHVQSVELNGLVYYVGGLLGWPSPASGFVYVYDPSTDRFSTATPMLHGRKRGAGAIAIHDGKIYVAGGLHAGVAVPWFDVFDPATGRWAALPDMPRSRDHFQGAVVGDRFYAIGGRRTSIDATVTANDAFDFTTGRWVTGLARLPTARGGFAVAVLGKEVLVIGGEGGGRVFDTVESYDTVHDSWTTRASMPTARHGVQAAVCGTDVRVVGGGMAQGAGAPTNADEVLVSGAAPTCG